ncbi:MAG: site-specific integrase [Coriobacteriaceae bacterium]|uniref:tyrosine-type recombinase/integrase n=1 Tax=Tractidigestivibacter sp. TaxID=2847320 RepID=UPI002A837507|nr:tyrosine-type recombinase/integrase [Tractidigestivibacter sp.]MCI6845364.1 site-specific integrase [Coriobacteriaceae bacterium]MDY4535073.1 tyrosine-type recombinase/integrase [Tractidigestivibacter sp.]
MRTFHTVEGKTRRQAEHARDALILELERKGGAVGSSMSVREFMEQFLAYKEESDTIEPSTVRGYRTEARQIDSYIGNVRLADLSVEDVSGWMRDMRADGYAPKSVSKPFRLLKQALKWGMAQDLITKNPCDFCKPPKRVKTPINALPREERTRMLELARRAQPAPLGIAIELALTTGMRRGEICALRWSDLSDDGTITVSHALGNGDGGFYVKEPKTSSSLRTIPLTRRTFDMLRLVRADAVRVANEFALPFGDPYILGTQEERSRPYNPTQLGKDFSAFCKMNGFKCTFHDLRHTFATMMIAGGCDVRTVASYLGHASVSMTLDIYADVDPEAKRAAVSKVEESFDAEMGGYGDAIMESVIGAPERREPALSFSVDQLKAMLVAAEEKEAKHGRL